ncbi:MAG: S-adenosyl-methyltransferase [Flavobacteriaceae bacterium]|nr:S-adenosyl-methyltransferase [Flavobacteriaceae bacterium]|tara:strand:- start:161 stop:475 length:315 start_codon:yes stop_codon:yes gene_type:complete
MRKKIFDIINGRLIIEQTNLKNIRFVMFLFFLAVIMIYSSHSVDTKIYKLNDLSKEFVIVENEFIEKRKEIVRIKMESNIKIKLSDRGIAPSLNPPTKIVITKE